MFCIAVFYSIERSLQHCPAVMEPDVVRSRWNDLFVFDDVLHFRRGLGIEHFSKPASFGPSDAQTTFHYGHGSAF